MVRCNKRILFWLLITTSFLFQHTFLLHAATIGNPWTIEEHWLFEGPVNKILAEALMGNGFTLQDTRTTCTFESYYPVSGVINLNGGTLDLSRDMIVDRRFFFGNGGNVFGNGFIIEFRRLAPFNLYNALLGGAVFLSTDIPMLANVNSVDWSHDDLYVLGGSDRVGAGAGTEQVRLYEYDPDVPSLTLTSSVWRETPTLSEHANSVRWHPTEDYVALSFGTLPGYNDVFIYEFDEATSELIYTGQGDGVYGASFAIDWSPDGQTLAVGTTGDRLTPANDQC